MAYVLNGLGGVTVERSNQSMRPRENGPPSRSRTSASPQMAERALRPRENARVWRPGSLGSTAATRGKGPTSPTSTIQSGADAITDKYLTQVAGYKGQQAKLEKLLQVIGLELKSGQNQVKKLGIAGDKVKQAVVIKECLMLEQDAYACIEAIKACAKQATQAAYSAVATGASQSDVREASSAGTQAGSQAGANAAASGGMQQSSTLHPVQDTSAADHAALVAAKTQAIEDQQRAADAEAQVVFARETAIRASEAAQKKADDEARRADEDMRARKAEAEAAEHARQVDAARLQESSGPAPLAVESSTVTVTPSGELIPGPGATVIDTATGTPVVLTAPTASASSSGIPWWVWLVAAGVTYKVLKSGKKS